MIPVLRLVNDDEDDRFWQGQIDSLASTFLRTTFLFLPGGVGLGGTMVTSALDRARPADSFGMQMLDASLGAAAGGTTRALFNGIKQFQANPIFVGAASGWTSHMIDVTSRRQTYINADTGKAEIWNGMKAIGRASFSPEALVAMGLSAGLAGLQYPLGMGPVDRYSGIDTTNPGRPGQSGGPMLSFPSQEN